MIEAEAEPIHAPLFEAAKRTFLVMLLLLPWMKHGVTIRGLEAYPTDFVFLLTMALWLAALITGQTRLRLHPSFLLLAFYFAAMAVSAIVSFDPRTSAFKLLTQVYLLALPVLAFNLVRTETELKRALAWWLCPAIAVGAYGVATLLLFPFFGWDSFLRAPLHHFGTLPPGPYPRIELTFEFPAMLANYLGVSLMFLLIAKTLGWLGRTTAVACAAALLVSAFFALTPGFGGIVAMLALWIWYLERERRQPLALLALAAACGTTALEVLVAAVTPIIHPTAPFLIHVPGISAPLAPAVRLLAWIDAARNFLAAPIFGHGIGIDPVHVLYQAPEASAAGYVTDAHEIFLSLAAQCGIPGLLALCAIIWFVLHEARSAAGSRRTLAFGLCIAWLCGFAIQGLVGSFEDSRHLWILLGLILSAIGLDRPAPLASQGPAHDEP
jgi:O-antigen ligase